MRLNNLRSLPKHKFFSDFLTPKSTNQPASQSNRNVCRPCKRETERFRRNPVVPSIHRPNKVLSFFLVFLNTFRFSFSHSTNLSVTLVLCLLPAMYFIIIRLYSDAITRLSISSSSSSSSSSSLSTTKNKIVKCFHLISNFLGTYFIRKVFFLFFRLSHYRKFHFFSYSSVLFTRSDVLILY